MVLFQCHIKEQRKGEIKINEFRTLLVIQYKPTSLYQKGMKVLVSYDGLDWKRTGTSIVYGKSSIEKS